MKISALIVDDEPKNRILLKEMLKEACPSIKVIGLAEGVEEAITLIKQYSPQLIFLDIEMSRPDEGFQLFELLANRQQKPEIVFVTAHEKYILRAFNETNAAGYLLKPIDPEELLKVIFKVKQRIASLDSSTSLEGKFQVSDVLYCYTKDEIIRIKFTDGKEKVGDVPTLDYYETTYNFFRTNRQYAINLQYVNKIVHIDADGVKTRNGTVLLFSGEKIPISTSRKAKLSKLIRKIS